MAEVKVSETKNNDFFTYDDWKKSVERCDMSITDYINQWASSLQNLSTTNFIPKDNADYGGTLTRIVKYNSTLSEAEKVYLTKVLYNNPATVVFWSDGTTTKNVCPPDTLYNPDAGLAFCMLRKFMGNDNVAKLFNDWELKDYKNDKNHYIEIKDVRKIHKDAKKK